MFYHFYFYCCIEQSNAYTYEIFHYKIVKYSCTKWCMYGEYKRSNLLPQQSSTGYHLERSVVPYVLFSMHPELSHIPHSTKNDSYI